MYQIIIMQKSPVRAGALDHPSANLEEVTPAQARYAFHNGWVPPEHLEAMAEIARFDGETDFPKGES